MNKYTRLSILELIDGNTISNNLFELKFNMKIQGRNNALRN